MNMLASRNLIVITLLFLLVSVTSSQELQFLDLEPREERAATSLLYSNGSFVSHPGGGANGADASRVQNLTLGMMTNGFNSSVSGIIHLADQFVIPNGSSWYISTVTVYGYQVGAPTTSSFNDARLQIRAWDQFGAPGNVVFGDLTTNRIASTFFTNTYRDTESSIGNTQRPIMAIMITVDRTLTPGIYFIDFKLGGSSGTSTAVPPVTIAGQTGKPDAYAMAWTGSSWAFLQDSGTSAFQDIPFLVSGHDNAVPVSLSGRVLQSGGRGVTNATVVLSTQSGQPRTVTTGRNGSFLFDQLQAGQTYTVAVTSRRFQYASRQIQIVDSVSDYDFTPIP